MSPRRGGRASPARVVLVSAPPRRARALARALVERRVAACVQVLPGVTSTYRWKGKVEETRESLLVVKTAADRIDALERAVVELHPYEVPEFVVLPVERGLEAYVEWLRAETRPTPRA